LQSATSAFLAQPLYNFGVSQHVKTWIDLSLVGAAPGNRLLEDKPVVLVTTRDGAYGAGTPREGWDDSTDYLRRILGELVERWVDADEGELALHYALAALIRKKAEEAARSRRRRGTSAW
jgi:FMN-dependent NADH-azoreductase